MSEESLGLSIKLIQSLIDNDLDEEVVNRSLAAIKTSIEIGLNEYIKLKDAAEWATQRLDKLIDTDKVERGES